MRSANELAHLVSSNFFLKKHTLQPSTQKLLRNLYPNINWKRVDFYEGLPWFTPLIAPYVNAQALPQFYSLGRFSIYLKKIDESRAQCLADLVHESFHVLQALQAWKGYGLGILRGFTVYYLAFFMRYGYANNPMEIPAFDQEFRFLYFCERYRQHGVIPKIDLSVLKYISHERALIFRRLDLKYNENPLRLVAGFFICLALVFLKPLADLVAYLIKIFTVKKPVTED